MTPSLDLPPTASTEGDTSLEVLDTLKEMKVRHALVHNLSELSHQATILLIFRRFTNYGGCALCNRRMIELIEWNKSLKQLNIVPVIVYPEPEEIGEKFFSNVGNLLSFWLTNIQSMN